MNEIKLLFSKTAAPGGRSALILVVDDDDSIRGMLETVFQKLKYRTQTAKNGREGVDLYQQLAGKVDLVILDLKMPVMDGRAAFEEIRRIRPDQKILMISGNANDPDLKYILTHRNVNMLKKPFTIQEIIHEVNQLI